MSLSILAQHVPETKYAKKKKKRNCLLIWLFNRTELFVLASYMYCLQKVLCVLHHWILTGTSLPSQKSLWTLLTLESSSSFRTIELMTEPGLKFSRTSFMFSKISFHHSFWIHKLFVQESSTVVCYKSCGHASYNYVINFHYHWSYQRDVERGSLDWYFNAPLKESVFFSSDFFIFVV